MKTNDVTIRLERPEEYSAVEFLVREAFWNVYRPGCSEHYVLRVLRDDPAFVKELDFVMERGGVLIGQNMFMRTVIDADDGRSIPILTMGPICITPELKRQGYGKLLLDESIRQAEAMGAGLLCITGNILFYGKSGFVVASTLGIGYEDAQEGDEVVPYFLARELKSGYIGDFKGSFKEPAPYFVCETDPEGFARFDATFPEKEKLVLPGQLNH